jgi:uncharacterized membrane protein
VLHRLRAVLPATLLLLSVLGAARGEGQILRREPVLDALRQARDGRIVVLTVLALRELAQYVDVERAGAEIQPRF